MDWPLFSPTQRCVRAGVAALGLALLIGCGPSAPPPAAPSKTTASPPSQAKPVVEPLTPNSDALAAFRGDLVARGTEPFWNLTVYAGRSFVFTTPDSEGREVPYRAPVQANAGVVMMASQDITVALREAACSDGMSDLSYPWQATVTIGASAPRKGCAYPRWSNDLQALIGAIDACLARDPGKPAAIVWGARDATGATIRVRRGEARVDCRVTPQGETTLTPVKGDGPDSMKSSEEDLIFYRAPSPNPGGQCYEATKALGPRGEDLGWLDTNEGC